MRILKYDNTILANENLEVYTDNGDNYTSYPWLKSGWTVPFVTGHKYKISWGNNGLDWDQMEVELSERWVDSDKSVYFVHNFTDVRHQYDTTLKTQTGTLPKDTEQLKNNTINFLDDTQYKIGNNVLYNETDVRQFHFIVNGKQPEANKITESRSLKFVAHRCIGDCDEIPPEVECPKEIRRWSVNKDWSLEEEVGNRASSGNFVPADGESFTVPSTWNL